VLRLLFDEQKSVAEAARFLGVDEQTVRSAKHKALSRLREHFS
jgi:DNA-directed RNA polymerase specialized sigma24 family protein